jgi:hypothetical protein
MANRTYTSESHRKYSEACQREVDEMAKHPLSIEQMEEQMDRNRAEILRRQQAKI